MDPNPSPHAAGRGVSGHGGPEPGVVCRPLPAAAATSTLVPEGELGPGSKTGLSPEAGAWPGARGLEEDGGLPMAQWLGLHGLTAGGSSSILVRELGPRATLRVHTPQLSPDTAR